MADEPENLTLVFLRRLDTKMDALAQGLLEVKERLGFLETSVASLHTQYAHLSGRMDRLELRMERVERRLDITEAV